MKLFNIMNGFDVLRGQWAAICHATLKKVVIAGVMVLSLSAGTVLAQTQPTVTITPNYSAETLTLSCSVNTYDTYYWSTDGNITTQDLADEEGLQGSELSVAGMPHGTTVYVWAMHLNGDTPEWSEGASYLIERYNAPTVTANYTSISNHIFTVTNPNTGGSTTVRYAVGSESTVSSDAVTGGTLAVTEYYTTYNFRVFGGEKFPSENVSKSTNRYNPPVIVDYVHYAAASGSSPEVPTSGTLYSELGSYIYINHGIVGASDTLLCPVPGDANSYNMVLASGSLGAPVPSTLTGDVFKMVAGPNPDDLSSAEMFPSPMVSVDNQYSGFFVVQHSASEAGVTTHHYLSLDNNRQLLNDTTFNYSCLWRLDNENRLYQQIGTTKYYVASDLTAHTNTTHAKRWRIHPISHLLQDVDGNRLSYDGGAWRLSRPITDMEYYNTYMVGKLHAEGGTYDEITRFELSAVKNGGDETAWLALANGDAACSLRVTPRVTVTTYQLPAHDHYSYTDETNDVADFTYYARTRQSYASHRDLPYQSVASNGVNNTPSADYIQYLWHLEYDEADGSGLALGTAALSGAEAINTIGRVGDVGLPQRARLWVEATYTITNTGSHGETITESRTAASQPLVVYAEQGATTLTALNSDGTTVSPFVSGGYYLLANYAEHQAAGGTRHFLTATEGDVPYLSEDATPQRLFQLTFNTGHLTYDLKNMTLDQMLTASSTTSNYVNDQSAVTYGGMTTTDQHEFVITPYSDGTNTYFTIRPYMLNDGVAASLVPQGGSLQEGATLRLVNSKGSEHIQGTGGDATSASFSEDYYRTSRWQLVVPTLLPPDIAMDNEGNVTLTDVRPFITGSLHYQMKAVGSDEWSTADVYVDGTTAITLHEGDMLRVWKEGTGDHSTLGQSATKEFAAEKVAMPTATSSANNNLVTLGTTTPDATLYYTMASEAPSANPMGDGSTLYSGPFELSHAGTLQCRAYASNMLMSDVLVYEHTAVLPLQIVAENGYATLGMSDNSVTSGYSIYYTTDGSLPTTTSTLYSEPISLEGVLVLKAKAFPNEENNGYAASPVESYYPNSLMLTFCYLDQDRVESHIPEAADTNMMLLNTGNDHIVHNDHDIDATFLWRCSNDITSNASKLFNEATASYLTFDANGGVYGTTHINDAKEWLWTGEPNAANPDNTGKYYLSTTVGEDVYYLAFDKSADQWTVTTDFNGENLELAVAYRTDLVAYPGGQEFSVDG